MLFATRLNIIIRAARRIHWVGHDPFLSHFESKLIQDSFLFRFFLSLPFKTARVFQRNILLFCLWSLIERFAINYETKIDSRPITHQLLFA